MIGRVLKISIISLLFIFLTHYLFDYFKTMLTTPKIRDIGLSNQKVQQLMEVIGNVNNATADRTHSYNTNGS